MDTYPLAARPLDHLIWAKTGDQVTLRLWNDPEISLHGLHSTDERAELVAFSQDRVTFRQDDETGQPYEWDAYRFDGRWAYGSDAALVEVLV